MAQAGQDSIDDKCRIILIELYDSQSLDGCKIMQRLADLRVLTREKTISTSVLDTKCSQTLVNLASKGQIEAQKCLSNLILNYAHLRETLIEPYVVCVEQRFHNILSKQSDDEQHDEESQPHFEILYYDMRIIFLLSALCAASRTKIRDRLLSSLLKVTLLEAEQFCQQNHLLVIESLKTLFNLTMEKCVDADMATKVIKKLFSYVDTKELENLESNDGAGLDHTDKLLVNLIHLLTNMPEEVYLELSDEVVDKVLNHLDHQLKTNSKARFRETILPVLNACANVCRFKKGVCKRWFDQIIVSTKEFDKRPEEYDTLRGRLVKLMTSVDVHIKEIAAEFLYALCGEDTERFITYTGFGNSAAFLSRKGLLSNNGERTVSNLESDGEYREIRERLDPITGKIEQPKKNPMDGMSEEEKEWHAHELAGAIAKLSNLGVIKPMKIEPDGEMSDICPKTEKSENNSEDKKTTDDSKS